MMYGSKTQCALFFLERGKSIGEEKNLLQNIAFFESRANISTSTKKGSANLQ